MTHLDISRSALRNNVGILRQQFPNLKLWPCVKANAYGHGIKEVVTAIDDVVDGYCVVSTHEALDLRPLTTKPIMVLNIVYREDILACSAAHITLPLASSEQVAWYSESNQPLSVHIEIDTGMARTGWLWSDPSEMVQVVRSLPQHVQVTGLFSHYAAAGEDDAYTREQFKKTQPFVAALQAEVAFPLEVHIDKSASLWNPTELRANHDWRTIVRPGIVLYGLPPTGFLPPGLQPVLTWKTELISLRHLPRGADIGYGLTYTTTDEAYIGTVPVGYCEGYARALSNRGEMLVRGQRCPVRGRVCMNLTMIEVPPDAQLGDEVVVIGGQGKEYVSGTELGKRADTTHYEIITRLPVTMERRLVD
jgi:alanine racemase